MTAAVAQGSRREWWVPLVVGILAIIVGGLMLANPFRMANILAWAVGLYFLITGIVSLVRIFFDRHNWGWKLIFGIIGIIAGWYLIDAGSFERTAAFLGAVVLVLAIQGIIMGITGLIEAFRGGGWGPGIMGGLALIIGFFLLGNIWASALVLPWVIAMFMIIGGIFAIIMAFRLRSA